MGAGPYCWGMDWGLLGFVIGGLTLAATLVFGWLTFFKQFPNRSLTYEVTTSPMLNPRAEGLKVFLDGVEMRSPYVVILQVTARSRADIPSNAFDASQPLVFDFGREVMGTPSIDASLRHELTGSQVKFPPQLVRKRSVASVAFVTEGAPLGVTVNNPLVDVGITEVNPDSASDLNPTKLILSFFGTCAALIIAIVFVILLNPF